MPKKKKNEDLTCRTIPLAVKGDKPSTLNEEERSYDVVMTTENPAVVFDWKRYAYVNEVLLMSGMELPKVRKLPLLDSHSRFSVSNQMGSVKDIRVEGNALIGKARVSKAEENAWIKVSEGHVTDHSIGYRVLDHIWIKEGESQEVDGRRYEGPLKISTKWKVIELSMCPIGADEDAKVRAGVIGEELVVDAKQEEDSQVTEEEKRKLEEENKKLEEEKKAAEEKVAEAKREAEQLKIKDLVRTFEDKLPEAVRDEVLKCESLALAKETTLKHLADYSETIKTGYRAVHSDGEDERQKFRKAAESSLLLRMNHNLEGEAREMGRPLSGHSLKELCREVLTRSGRSVPYDPMEMVGKALTTSDLPYILSNVANKVLMKGFNTFPDTWRVWSGKMNVSNFQITEFPRGSEFDDLVLVPENGEITMGYTKDAGEQAALATYARLYPITRQVIINDNVNYVQTKYEKAGKAARRKEGDVVYALLTLNHKMGDGKTIFHADHKNLASVAAKVSETALNAAYDAMGTQVDENGAVLCILPQFLIAPVNQRGSIAKFFKSEGLEDDRNIYEGSQDLTRIFDPRLTGTAWYLTSSPGESISRLTLNGVETPTIEGFEDKTHDRINLKVRYDTGAVITDWRGAYKNPGAA